MAKPRRANAAEPAHPRRLELVAGHLNVGTDQQERLIYDRLRLGIMSGLSVTEKMSFAELKQLLKTSDGNLSTHARKLEEAGYIGCRKSFSQRLPRTEYRLTAKGRRAFARYLKHMEALIQAARDI